MTAHITLFKHGKAKSGDRVLINGGTSGVGVFAIQMAKAIGCYVVVTCSSASFDTVKGFGADEVVDYKDGNLTEKLSREYGSADKRFDIVFDVSHSLSCSIPKKSIQVEHDPYSTRLLVYQLVSTTLCKS